MELGHGELWAWFPDAGLYGIASRLTLQQLQWVAADMCVHARTNGLVPSWQVSSLSA